MPETALSLTPAQTLGLFFIGRYRFLTIAQVAKVMGLSKRHVEDVLYAFFLRGIIGHFGSVTILYGRTLSPDFCPFNHKPLKLSAIRAGAIGIAGMRVVR